MNMYANYIKEKTGDLVYETDKGFAVYRYVGEDTVYILDIYVFPESRHKNVASSIADDIVMEAKKKGCTKLLGSVVPSLKNSVLGLKVLLAYGMVLDSSSNDFILLKKEII